jgi:hypothetical protein
MEGSVMDFRVELTISEYGRDDHSGSRLFEAIERVTPGTEPVLAGNFEDGLLKTVFHVETHDAANALARARSTFDAALDDAGMPMTRLVGIGVSLAEVALPAA